jgi:hypothetical protein
MLLPPEHPYEPSLAHASSPRLSASASARVAPVRPVSESLPLLSPQGTAGGYTFVERRWRRVQL